MTTRRRDAEGTRARILEVARCSFSRHGYEGTTVRTVAAAAGVSPNLITRYFGGKAGLFTAATTIDLGVAGLLPGPAAGLGRRIAAGVVRRWESAGDADPLLMMMRAAGSSEAAAAALGEFFDRQATRPLIRHLIGGRAEPPPGTAERAAAVGALVCGVVTIRYVMGYGPLAAARPDALEDWLADRLQRLLDDPAPPSLSA